MKKRLIPLFLSMLVPFAALLSACSAGVGTESGVSGGNASQYGESGEPVSSPESGTESSAGDPHESGAASQGKEESADPQGGESAPESKPEQGESSVAESSAAESEAEISGDTSAHETSGDVSEPETSGDPGQPGESGGHPVLCGGFMQPGAFASYTVQRMKQHLSYMKEVGIDILILQWSFDTEGGKVNRVYFNQSFGTGELASGADVSASGFLDMLLSAAEQTGTKVFVGLNDSGEWWSKGVNDRGWIETQARLGTEGAKQLYEKYAKKYPNAFYGWYFVFEFYNQKVNSQQIENAAYLLNLYRDGLYGIAPDMPMMLSPFISASGTKPDQTGSDWKAIFSKTHFREGDIYCCQDSVGAGHITIDKLDAYFKAIKAAVDTKPGLKFWANNEDFTQADWTTAPLTRFVRQLQISDKYVEAHVTFAYSHYQNPDTGKTGYHEAYKKYYQTGKIPACTLTKPNVKYVPSEDGNSVAISGAAANGDKTLMGIKITKNGEVIKFFDYSQSYGKSPFEFSYTDFNLEGAGTAVYQVFGVDFCGNEGPAFSFTIGHNGRSGRNAAQGKTYVLALQPEPQYPDEDGKTLTDGTLGQPAYYDAAWSGFLGVPEFVIDLGKVETAIYGFEVSTLGGGSAGVYAPTEITVYVSDDGVNFRVAASEKFPADVGIDSGARITRSIKLASDISGRYVKFTVATNQSWIFIDELRVFAD